MNKINLELLAPAKNLESGIAAINCGADAVYIGAPKFGARAYAGNSIEDIAKLIEYAHKFWVKVYVTVNTIIYDNEIDEVKILIRKLYEVGVDAVIFQDMALLEMDLPPIPLIASTQTNNYEIEDVTFLDRIGIKRIILARELSFKQIKEIRKNTKAELEFFIHGALCVCLSGQCYMSEAMLGRSANRGECAQPCRLTCTLTDAKGNIIIKDKHLLSIRDLNLSSYLNELIDAGITSFKIEGRLKDISYVKNITAYYRQLLDSLIEKNSSLKKSSSGYSKIPFTPDPDKTFNRGYCSYFFNGKDEKIGSINSPKSIGKFIGKVSRVTKDSFTIDTNEVLSNGDGLCFFDERGVLTGMNINNVKNKTIFTDQLLSIKKDVEIFRNFDHKFNNELKKECVRKIKTKVEISESEKGLNISAEDENGVSVNVEEIINKEPAMNAKQFYETLKKQFSKSGDTIFEIVEVKINLTAPLFLPIKLVNQIRRKVFSSLEKERRNQHKIDSQKIEKTDISYYKKKLDYKANVVNSLSKQFYKDHGVEELEEGFELQSNYSDKVLMKCKYCILDELGMCLIKINEKIELPLYLSNNKNKYKLEFHCKDCFMSISI